jgi:hypothetical protein
MSIPLPAATLAITKQVRDQTGKDVVVTESLEPQAGFAKVKVARKAMESHTIILDRGRADLAGYLVAHECGHIIRLFATPESERKAPLTNELTTRAAVSQIQDDVVRLARTIPEGTLSKMVKLWHQGLVSQVTSQPADIMIETWIYQEHPELRPLQKRGIDVMHQQVLTILKPGMAAMVPRKVYDASTIMNYAFFAAVGDAIASPYLRAFRSFPRASDGERLKEETLREPWTTLAGDIRMSNVWAELLGIREWFEWTEFENTPPGYSASV